jgi:hypothetical protein
MRSRLVRPVTDRLRLQRDYKPRQIPAKDSKQ